MSFTIKMARDKDEFDQIFDLNYETFVEEIPQHEQNDKKKLLDRFHAENQYIICKHDSEVIGMMAIRDIRPFSLDEKLGVIEEYLNFSFIKPCEVRLLAVKKTYRNGRVFTALTGGLIRYCLQKGHDIAFISGTTRQSKLYRHLGFQPFAHLVGKDEALFQPMYLTKRTFLTSDALQMISHVRSFLPGPVAIDKEVQTAFDQQPIWHRSEEHSNMVAAVKTKLKEMTNAKQVAILTGSGTLSNDAVAAHLAGLNAKGLILTNGEFGDRLVDHAERFQLTFDHISYDWGTSFLIEEIENKLMEGNYDWLWFVHCETSTGMLNDFKKIESLCKQYSVKLCVDAISSIGAVPLDLQHTYLATGVSGKAIGSYTGLSFVFYNSLENLSYPVPRYLDISYYEKCEGIPFSQSSNLFHALNVALDKFLDPSFIKERRSIFIQACEMFKDKGFHFVIDNQHSSPCVLTIAIPKDLSSLAIGEDLYLNGFLVHYRNRYLIENNWIQIALMNANNDLKQLKSLIRVMEKLIIDQSFSISAYQ
ncbi:aminotransferase class V-fold PLP-dependent enzyme [Heyndrickxia sp. FSL K6-6286]|uniref:aminotransferase class V-fold PLP-dependent enzyme n=1 Tax=Heyndrickxia sp. FSL K6-6286 TaxID=2921510 RepID=UPI00217E17D7|nr:aminotransferase class V-fold PLP-dependent enzyme [Heyndrickxia oleronia]